MSSVYQKEELGHHSDKKMLAVDLVQRALFSSGPWSGSCCEAHNDPAGIRTLVLSCKDSAWLFVKFRLHARVCKHVLRHPRSKS